MLTFLNRCTSCAQGTISFLYHDVEETPMPASYTDPLVLLGDIAALNLSSEQQEQLRTAIADDVRDEGPEEVWRTRALRKNVIHSFGIIV